MKEQLKSKFLVALLLFLFLFFVGAAVCLMTSIMIALKAVGFIALLFIAVSCLLAAVNLINI